MSNHSHPARWFCESCILFTAVMLLHGGFPVIAGLVANIIATIWFFASGILLVLVTWVLTEQLFLVLKMAANVGLKLTDTSHNIERKVEPPIIAEFLVGLCVNRRHRNGVLQNLEEDFEHDLAAGVSVRRARRKYWAATLNSIGPRLWALAKRVGIIGLIADYGRRLLH
jgi:hypothetical protein